MAPHPISTLLLALLPQDAPAPAPAPHAFVDVTAIPMTSSGRVAKPLPGTTVVVADGRITAIGADAVIPTDATRIDGKGRYLIPGLADMHTHIEHEDDLFLNLAWGVTTVMNMGSSPRILTLREEVAAGARLGPRIHAGLYVNARPADVPCDTPDEALACVAQAQNERWDFIKAYNGIPTDAFDALMGAALEAGIPVGGHAVREPGLEHVLLSSYAFVAHAEEYLYGFFGRPPEEERIPEAVGLTYETEAAVVATLSTYATINRQWGERMRPFAEECLARDDAKYLRPELRESWRAATTYADRSGDLDGPLAFQRKFVLALQEGGVPLLAGSDSPARGIIGTYPGRLLHQELVEFTTSGLTPYESLCTATANVGAFARSTLGEETDFGRIRAGAAADLVLLREDPLEDVANTRSIEGVMVGGRWLPAAWIAARLEERAAEYAAR